MGSSLSTVQSIRSVDDWSVKLPCKKCNEGWMNDLEGPAASQLRHLRVNTKRPISSDGAAVLTRWLAKTAYLLIFRGAGGT